MSAVNTLSTGTITRPGNTTTYADNDVITGASPAALQFLHPSAGSPGFVLMQHASISSSASQATKLDADLWLFTTTPAVIDVDNAAWTPTDADLLNLITVVEFRIANWRNGDATSGAGGNAVCVTTNLAVPIPTRVNNILMYGVLVARNAYVPIDSEIFTIRLALVAD